MQYLGSFPRGDVVSFLFNTRALDNTPVAFLGTPLLTVIDVATGDVVEDDIAPDVNVGGRTGLNRASLDTSLAAYDGYTEFGVVVKQGTVDDISVANECLRTFSLNAGTLPADSINAAAISDAAVVKVQAGLPSATANADALLARHYRGGSANSPTVGEALASGLLRFTINTTTGVMTILHSDGSVAATRTLTRAALNAIVSSVP